MNMKKIIIAQKILRELESGNSIFNRQSIMLFPARLSEEILYIHRVNKADLIITDAALPMMGGAMLCSKIRGDDAMKSVSIMVICDDQDATLSQCREAGANVVLKRPVDAGELLWKASELMVIPHRKDMRVLLRASIKGLEGNNPLLAKSHDISISGMQIESDRVLNVGDRLKCSFHIGHSEVHVNCVVERVRPGESSHRYGVRFVNCDTKFLIIIEQYVKGPIWYQKND